MPIQRLIAFLIFISMVMVTPSSLWARHKCPDPPPFKFSLLSIQLTVASTVASTIATGRTSNTSGCDRGHPSEGFYRPSAAIYLDETLEHVVEESSKGQGAHLDALASLAGCSPDVFPVFSDTLRKNYHNLFFPEKAISFEEKVDQVWANVTKMVINHPTLQKSCKAS